MGFALCYSFSLGPVGWIIQTDILPAKGISMAVMMDAICVSFLSCTYKPISNIIGAPATFWIFAGFNIFVNPLITLMQTFIFSWLVVQETKGNTDIENRILYTPKELREKLKNSLQKKKEIRDDVDEIELLGNSFNETNV